MIKKLLFSIIVVGVITALMFQPIRSTMGTNQTAGEVVAQVFAAGGAEVTEVSVQTWAKINNSYLTVTELTDIGWLVAGTFNREAGVLEPVEWQVASGEATGQRQVELTGTAAGQAISILLQSLTLTGNAQGEGETYLVVTIDDLELEIVTLEYQALNAFSPFQQEPRLAVLYTGQRSGRLDKEEKVQLIDTMLVAVNGHKVEGIAEDFLASYSGYTPLIANTWWTGSREINLQIGIRDHSHQDSTIIYVGYPLILTGY